MEREKKRPPRMSPDNAHPHLAQAHAPVLRIGKAMNKRSDIKTHITKDSIEERKIIENILSGLK